MHPIQTTDMLNIPDLPALMDLPLTQDGMDTVNALSQSTNREGRESAINSCETNSSTVDKPSPEAQRKTSYRISYMHKSARVQTSFFPLDTQDELYEMIAGDISLNV